MFTGCQLNSKKKLLVELLDMTTQQMADDSSMKYLEYLPSLHLMRSSIHKIQ